MGLTVYKADHITSRKLIFSGGVRGSELMGEYTCSKNVSFKQINHVNEEWPFVISMAQECFIIFCEHELLSLKQRIQISSYCVIVSYCEVFGKLVLDHTFSFHVFSFQGKVLHVNFYFWTLNGGRSV